ncbi:hypothetical protein [Tautonia marina]|uniref:hypothetical protein n=1 Tax=Tautonia marina TaxID=2653855 RepID=UPI001376474E|nr:hypothetical protein [Tautonia marina]
MRPPSPRPSSLQEVPETFGPDTFRLIAREVLRLEIEDDQMEPLRSLVNGLSAELAPMTLLDLDGIEPDVAFALDPEGWPR